MSRYSYTSGRSESQGPTLRIAGQGGPQRAPRLASRRARYSELPGMVRALLHRLARGSTLYVPHNGVLSSDDLLLADYLYLRWVVGWKHTVAVAEVAADAGLSVDTVVRRLREIRRRRGEQTVRGVLHARRHPRSL